MNLSQRFADAFNTGDLDDWAACFVTDATAQVLDAPFPIERGRDIIKATSCNHMLNEADVKLVARVSIDQDGDVVMFLHSDDETKLDCIAVVEGDDLVERCQYRVWWHSEDWLADFASRHSLSRP
ncbi:nuclear transport factor 2 family protein [Planctomycetota bacterium]|nr:nuclear transport factor 2 family protein [Planctomycetota bacterium]